MRPPGCGGQARVAWAASAGSCAKSHVPAHITLSSESTRRPAAMPSAPPSYGQLRSPRGRGAHRRWLRSVRRRECRPSNSECPRCDSEWRLTRSALAVPSLQRTLQHGVAGPGTVHSVLLSEGARSAVASVERLGSIRCASAVATACRRQKLELLEHKETMVKTRFLDL